MKASQTPEGPAAVRTLDLRDLLCPLPVLKARKALRAMAPGERLHVEATDPMALIDLPHCCAEDGHLLVSKETRDGVHHFVIERGRQR